MDFLRDYLLYNSGNMVPKRYHRWSALSLLAMTTGLKTYIDQGYYQINPTLYSCLVGRMGLRKTTAKSIAKTLFVEAFPDYPVGASVMSREKIVEHMASDECLRTYVDETNTSVPWKPLAFFINELKNFMSINPGAMVEFLTDISDQKFFDASTIKHGLQAIVNPCVNILACETPKWIIDKLKMNIIAGGFSRRMLYIYETERPQRITFPYITRQAHEARARCLAHLKNLSSVSGPFKWDGQETKDFFDKWFQNLHAPDDEILEGFYEAKDTLILKLAMLHALASYEPKLLITKELLEVSIATLETDVEDNLPRLTIAAGRNESAIPQQNLLDLLEKHGGMYPWKMMLRDTDRDMGLIEQTNVIRHLKDVGMLHEATIPVNGVKKSFAITDRKYKDLLATGQLKEQNALNPTKT